jgi:hypothetical protein
MPRPARSGAAASFLSAVLAAALVTGTLSACEGAPAGPAADVAAWADSHDDADAAPLVDASSPVGPDAAAPTDTAAPADTVAPPDHWSFDVPGGEPTDELLDRIDAATYVIVTTDALAPAFERLADWRRRTGLPTQVVTMTQVRREATGRDDAEVLRTWLRRTVAEQGTQIVLLGGDTPGVPHRTVFVETKLGFSGVSYETSAWAATELYFADLDGDWDGDGDGQFGEFEDGLDMVPDVAVGRVPAGTRAEAEAYVDKVLAYEGGAAADYQDRVLFLSEYTGFGDLDASLLLDTWDRRLFGPDFAIEKLYDDPTHYPDARQNTTEDEIAALEAGVGIVAHLGHGSEGSFAFLDLDDVAALRNGPRFSAFFSCACYSGNFAAPRRATGEEFVLNGDGGGVVYVGNTDIGIGFPSGAMVLAEVLRRLLADDPPRVGEAFAAARMTFVPRGGGTFEDLHADRYTQFVVVLLGDPALRMWRRRPVPAALQVAARQRADAPFALSVQDHAGAPVAGATVTLYRPGELLVVTRSDAAGLVRFARLDVGAGPLDVTISGAGLVPRSASVAVE